MALLRSSGRDDQGLALNDGDTIAVTGGGPSGSFFAIRVLREARRAGRHVKVVIIEKGKSIGRDGISRHGRGCNHCAGGISPRLNDVLEQSGLAIPGTVIRGEVDTIWVQGLWKNFPFKVPEDMRMYSVLRGSFPQRAGSEFGGFDGFLLREAVKEGAEVVSGEVLGIDYSDTGMPRLEMNPAYEASKTIEASFVAVSTGINIQRGSDYGSNPLICCLRRINPRFSPARTRKALIFELEVGQDYLKKHMNREIYFVEYGSKELSLEHIALVPKRELLTVALIGRSIDEAELPKDARRIVREVLALPHMRRILPSMEPAPLACICAPRMAVRAARHPYADRVALIGDAVGSRLNKDGLYSAYRTATQLADTVLHHGIDERSLETSYGPAVEWLARDNRYGELMFGVSRLTFRTPVVSRIVYQAFATELKVRDKDRRPLGTVLWKMASGTSDYREVLKGMSSLPVLRSFLVGGVLVTLRNTLTEMLFGVKWGEYGRYPTVIMKEKRGDVKRAIEQRFGIEIGESPEFERMYKIKIRASPRQVFDELGKFGDERRNYLKLRSLEIKRISGLPNEVGSVIEYNAKLISMTLRMRLTSVVPDRALLYAVDEKFADRGKLVFDIERTKDGNWGLVLYAAFDFKRGKRLIGRIYWSLFRIFFPAFLHDIFWNHALCRIKEDVEDIAEEDVLPARSGAAVCRQG